MTDEAAHEAWHKNNYKRTSEIEDNLSALPGFEAMMADTMNPPEVVVFCPKGHRIIRVVIETDHNWHPFLATHPDEAEATDPVAVDARWSQVPEPAEAENKVHGMRVRLRCPQEGCGYEGTPLGSTLLGQAAAVALAGKSKLRLTS